MAPKNYRKLKKSGELESTITQVATSALETYRDSLERLMKTQPAQVQFNTKNPTYKEISAAFLNNQMAAREFAEEKLKVLMY